MRGHLYPAYEGLAWLQCAVSLEISIVARHCCHACPDLSHSEQRTVVTTTYLYDSETAGPACRREHRRRRIRLEDGPVGVGSPGVGQPLPRAPHAINQTRWGMAIVIV